MSFSNLTTLNQVFCTKYTTIPSLGNTCFACSFFNFSRRLLCLKAWLFLSSINLEDDSYYESHNYKLDGEALLITTSPRPPPDLLPFEKFIDLLSPNLTSTELLNIYMHIYLLLLLLYFLIFFFFIYIIIYIE